ncbi:MAG TPA: MogA/MoaB family molybdenum cofactor biosynthesis protein [Clostridiales bacterium]|nr:MogA/MoaB family molybdenum cofactor biosynthesis protein [Clostridiales bacterium]
MRFAVLCISDRCHKGLRKDESGPMISELTAPLGETVLYECLPDERELIAKELARICDNNLADIILTTGGTGLAARDLTPEATLDIADRPVPGLAEAMRQKSLEITPMAMLSRAVAVVRAKTLIINLPGSPKAVKENLQTVLPVLKHAFSLLNDKVEDCAKPHV